MIDFAKAHFKYKNIAERKMLACYFSIALCKNLPLNPITGQKGKGQIFALQVLFLIPAKLINVFTSNLFDFMQNLFLHVF